MGRRTLLLLAALAVAALGTVLVFLYVRGLEARYVREQALQSILVAQTEIAPGTSLRAAANEGAVLSSQVPGRAVVPGAISDIGNLGDRVATATIFPGEQILATRFAPSLRPEFDIPEPEEGQSLSANRVAVTVNLPEERRGGGLLQAGSTVAVMVTYGTEGGRTTKTLFSRVTVLATGSDSITDPAAASGTRQPEQGGSADLVTLALSSNQAHQVINAADQGDLYLAVLDADSQVGSHTVTRENWAGS